MYTALMIDLKKSRSYSDIDRFEIQDFFLDAMFCLNYIFEPSLAQEVSFSAGDELQGLFIRPEAAFLYLRLFKMLIFPVQVHAGIGYGDWSIQINDAGTTAQDGPTYHNARHAIFEAKKAADYSALIYSRTNMDSLLNTLMNSCFLLTENQSLYQNELMILAEIMWPIWQEGLFPERMPALTDIMQHKYRLQYFSSWKHNNQKYPFSNLISMPYPFNIAYNEYKKSYYVASGRPRGASQIIAEITGTSRQSVDRVLKAGNIFEERNTAITTAQYLSKL